MPWRSLIATSSAVILLAAVGCGGGSSVSQPSAAEAQRAYKERRAREPKERAEQAAKERAEKKQAAKEKSQEEARERSREGPKPSKAQEEKEAAEEAPRKAAEHKDAVIRLLNAREAIGKTVSEVEGELGKPDAVSEDSPGNLTLSYSAGNNLFIVNAENGRVVSIRRIEG